MDQWALQHYPSAWEQVKKLSKRIRHNGGMVYNINRNLRA